MQQFRLYCRQDVYAEQSGNRLDRTILKTPIAALSLLMLLSIGDLAAQSIASPVVNPIDDSSIYPIAVWAMEARTAPAGVFSTCRHAG